MEKAVRLPGECQRGGRTNLNSEQFELYYQLKHIKWFEHVHSLDLFLIYLVVGEDACPDMWRFCHGVSGVEILALERWRKEDQKSKAVLTMDLVALVLLHLSDCGVFLYLGPTQKQRLHPISQVPHGVVLSPLREHHNLWASMFSTWR